MFNGNTVIVENKAIGVMKAGNCFTIEPMINYGSWQDHQWPDRWTAVTVDGKRSAQFEQTLLVTDTGCEVLTKRRENGIHVFGFIFSAIYGSVLLHGLCSTADHTL